MTEDLCTKYSWIAPNTEACIDTIEPVCNNGNGNGNGGGNGNGAGNGNGQGNANGQGKGNGEDNGNGQGNAYGWGNGNGEISCSQCKTILKDWCEFTYPGRNWCPDDTAQACELPCNDNECQKLTEFLCSWVPADSVDACNANVKQGCLNNTGNGNGRFLY